MAIMVVLSFCIFTGCEDAEDVIHSDSKPVAIASFGNPNVSKAVEDPEYQIANLRINGRNGMSYSWTKKNSTLWGAAPTDAEAIAVAGYLENGVFQCSKFDWIGLSRTTRDFKNLNTGYNGWPAEKFYAAKTRCFFIMSKDGKKRTNIIFDN